VDATGEGFLKSYIREDYATLLSTLDERRAIVFGRAPSCTEPVLVRPDEASKSPARLLFVVDKIPKHERDRVSQDLLDYCHREGWRWSGWSRTWKAWPELLHDAGRLGLNKPDGYLLGSYRIATAPEPNSSRLTSLKSTRFDSLANNVGPWPVQIHWDV